MEETAKDYVLVTGAAPSGVFSKEELKDFQRWICSRCSINRQGSDRIYISRRQAAQRRVRNERDIIPILLDLNFQIVELEGVPVQQQSEMFSKASVVVSIHGAALSNILFAPENCKVVELRLKSDDANNCYFGMAANLDLDFYYLMCEGELDTFHKSDIEVDVKKFHHLLQVVLESSLPVR